jgi:hypothetical protein
MDACLSWTERGAHGDIYVPFPFFYLWKWDAGPGCHTTAKFSSKVHSDSVLHSILLGPYLFDLQWDESLLNLFPCNHTVSGVEWNPCSTFFSFPCFNHIAILFHLGALSLQPLLIVESDDALHSNHQFHHLITLWRTIIPTIYWFQCTDTCFRGSDSAQLLSCQDLVKNFVLLYLKSLHKRIN